MKFATFALIAALTPSLASAATLVYKIDLKQSQMDEITAFGICGLPERIVMDAKKDLPTEVIYQTQAQRRQHVKIQYIQATSGSIQGGELEEPYLGKYRERVALVNVDSGNGYPGGVFQRIEVTTYGSTAAPKAFIVTAELLNYRGSAELAEGSICTGYAYALQ